MNEKAIEVTLDVKLKDEDLVAVLQFINTSLNPIFIDKSTLGLNDEITSRVFDIRDSDNVRVTFKGKTIKRKFDKGDFLKLGPNQSTTASINLFNYYEFLDGEHEYTIKYDAINHSYEDQKMFEMISNTVVVKISK